VEKPPKKSTTRELVEAGVEGAAGMVPIVGSPIAVAFAVAMGWTYNKRMTQWLEDLASAVDDLHSRMDEPLSFDDLADDPIFTDAVVNATRAAQATHREEKLSALRNAVLNSVLVGAPEIDEQARFFRLIEEFTPAHLTLIQYLSSPNDWFDAHGIDKPQFMSGSRAHLLEVGVPQFAGKADWYNLLAGDLNRASLTIAGLGGMVTGGGMWDPLLSPLGQRFLRFIQDPRT